MLYNVGVLGGSRQAVLTMIIKYLDIVDHNMNYNMAVVQSLIALSTYHRIPFQFRVLSGLKGVCVRHKWDQRLTYMHSLIVSYPDVGTGY